jgi:glycine oxidase
VGSDRDVIVVGAGVIGLAVAWRCAQRGLGVTVVDPTPGGGATHTAAGMLAPVTELHYEGRDLLALNLDSARRYPAWAADLAEATGIDIGYRETGTVQAAWDAADLAALRDLHAFHRTLGVRSEMLTGRELREAEPALAAGLPGGLLATEDHQVDPRALHAALLKVNPVRPHRVRGIAAPAGRATGVVLDDGTTLAAGTVVLAAGAWSGRLDGLPALPAVRPVKGQTLRLRGPAGLLTHVVRGAVKGQHVYIVPRANGELVIGASAEEAGFDVRPRAGAIYELLRDAGTLVPELSEAEFVEVSTGLRPGSPDNAPLLGPTPLDGLIVATGHYRNGVLLTPVTGDEIAALIATGRVPDAIAAFGPARLTEVPA